MTAYRVVALLLLSRNQAQAVERQLKATEVSSYYRSGELRVILPRQYQGGLDRFDSTRFDVPTVLNDYGVDYVVETDEYGPDKSGRTQIVCGAQGQPLWPRFIGRSPGAHTTAGFRSHVLATMTHRVKPRGAYIDIVASSVRLEDRTPILEHLPIAGDSLRTIEEQLQTVDALMPLQPVMKALKERLRCPGCDKAHYASDSPLSG